MSNDTVEEYVGGSYGEMVLERNRENTTLHKMKKEPWRNFGHQNLWHPNIHAPSLSGGRVIGFGGGCCAQGTL